MKSKQIINVILITIFLISVASLAAMILKVIYKPYAPGPDFMTLVFCALVVWIGVSHFVALLGDTRMVGYWITFSVSLLISPILALIIILFSKRKSTHEYEQKMLKHMEEMANKK